MEVGSGVFEVDPVTIFDLFQGQGLPEGKKSVACSMRLRAPDRTLSEKEVNQAFGFDRRKNPSGYTLRTQKVKNERRTAHGYRLRLPTSRGLSSPSGKSKNSKGN